MNIGEELGGFLGNKAREALGIEPEKCESYGKAAIVGPLGASWSTGRPSCTPNWAPPFRKALGRGLALIPSVKKRGPAGCTIDVPLNHKDAAFIRSHFDGMTISLEDAPLPDEILVALVVTRLRPPPAPYRRPYH